MLYLDAHNLGVIYLNKFLKLHKGESLPVYDPYLKYLPSYEQNWLSQFCYQELQMESTDQILELEQILFFLLQLLLLSSKQHHHNHNH